MNSSVLTNYDPITVNKLRSHYSNLSYPIENWPVDLKTYEQFSSSLPVCNKERLKTIVSSLIEKNKLNNCYFVSSSGTTGSPSFHAHRAVKVPTVNGYHYKLVEQTGNYVFTQEDIAANLFSAGSFNYLYENCCRIMEVLGITFLPIGRFDYANYRADQLLSLLKMFKVNTLLGTPSSIIQCAHLCQQHKIQLQIKKIVFTGEEFTSRKKEFIRTVWPQSLFFGLYGATETGFMGINTPHCPENHYHLISDLFFIEFDEDERLLVTCLWETLIPLMRFAIGDNGRLALGTCPCGNSAPRFQLFGRCDDFFNYMGNLVSFREIKDILGRVTTVPMDIQIQLETTVRDGIDQLGIVLDFSLEQLAHIENKAQEQLLNVGALREGKEKTSGVIRLYDRRHFSYSARQKCPPIVDNRSSRQAWEIK